MAKKITVVIPDEVYEDLNCLAKEREVTMSAIICSSIQFLKWTIKQKKEKV